MNSIKEIINHTCFTHDDLVQLLQAEGEEEHLLLSKARGIRDFISGRKVYLRGLIEFSNVCEKDCLYCGIRKSNSKTIRYNLADDEVLEACSHAYHMQLGSVVLQSGEVSTSTFVKRVDNLLKEIQKLSNGQLGITLSCGEQSYETYRRWFESGAHRYLLRIESSDRELYYKIHPHTKKHSFEARLESLHFLRDTGYQVGTGVMIGLPFQTIEHLAHDLLFFKKLDIDMCGMGPYIEHEDTPLYQYHNILMPPESRYKLALKMIASMRLLMPDVNMASSTAFEAIVPSGREGALDAGANIIMPNLTPISCREKYILYNNKPGLHEEAHNLLISIINRISAAGYEIGYGEWGDSMHFRNRSLSET